MEENYLLLGAKKRMIEMLRQKGITDEKVLMAFNKVDRHLFIESFLWDKAYENMPLPIYCNQTISQPYTVAFQSQLLEIKEKEKVLEIGTGSGFQAAILSAMGAKVYSIERQIELYRKTKVLLQRIDNSIIMHWGDGFVGLNRYAPFDKIIVTCGAPNVPISLLSQLKTGGCIIIPVGINTQEMKRITKLENDQYNEETFGNFSFVPMLEQRVSPNQTNF